MMFEGLNVWKRMTEAEDKVETLEARVALYEAVINEVTMSHNVVLENIEKVPSLIERLTDAMLRKIESDEQVTHLSNGTLHALVKTLDYSNTSAVNLDEISDVVDLDKYPHGRKK